MQSVNEPGFDEAGDDVVTATVRLPGDRARVSQFAAISASDLLRRALLEHRG